MWHQWWAWVVAGFAIGVLEVLMPGYIFLGFAIGAASVGVLLGLGLVTGGPYFLLFIFAVISVAAWAILRRTMGVREGQVKLWHKDIND